MLLDGGGSGFDPSGWNSEELLVQTGTIQQQHTQEKQMERDLLSSLGRSGMLYHTWDDTGQSHEFHI